MIIKRAILTLCALISVGSVAPVAAEPMLYVNREYGFAFLVPPGVVACYSGGEPKDYSHGINLRFSDGAPCGKPDPSTKGWAYIGGSAAILPDDDAVRNEDLAPRNCRSGKIKRVRIGIGKYNALECETQIGRSGQLYDMIFFFRPLLQQSTYSSTEMVFVLNYHGAKSKELRRRFDEILKSFMLIDPTEPVVPPVNDP